MESPTPDIPISDPSDLLTEEEAARRLRCGVRYLGYQRARGEIPFARIAGKVVYRREDIEEYIARRTVSGKGRAMQADRRAHPPAIVVLGAIEETNSPPDAMWRELWRWLLRPLPATPAPEREPATNEP
jgi:hypothetical protein